ncbi:hypothetical protein DFJ58DRAFT_729522 [Suillus subalutaceus]|uniref:uncharacterized protein n=1 Tax=Suillus subalutaceus TaxID=48586 RepID=UPI001B87C7BB|nr:uncharacterized protein DFJ58DRAFT_729522 [Suillus subalutaceus]KAG1849434.1 hypothetical protein DFJ58DRAFT_729522 [Suillus subalutaceus]
MPNALTLFKSNCTTRDSWLQAFDARAVAVQGNLVITMPNMHFVPEFHHFEEEDLQAHADGRFSEAFPFLHPLHWAWFTPSQDDLKSIPGNSFPVGMLAPDKVYGLQSLLKLAEQRVHDYRKDQLDRGQVIYSRLLCLHHAIAQLKSHPLTFRDLLIFVTNAQGLFLDIYSYIDWVLVAQPRTVLGFCHEVNSEWMGGFAQSSDICDKLFSAGVPAWYVCASAYIPPNMKVVEPVLLTRPDHIIISMYAEGRNIHPFEVIHRGQGGRNRHIHIRRLYAGTTHQDPGTDTSSQQSSSSSHPASGPKSSTLGKAPKQKGKQRHQLYSINAWPTQSGESRDKWKDPETPYLPPLNLHWEATMKIAIKDQFPKPALLLGPKLPEHLQLYLANWLAARPLWIGRVDHNPPRTYPTPQLWRNFLSSAPSVKLQSAKGKEPDKSLTATKKGKRAMWDLFRDDLLEIQGNIFSPEGVVEFRGEQVPVTSLATPPALLVQKITWELFELGFQYKLKDLNRYLARGCWDKDAVGHEQLLHSIFPGEAGLVMWSELFPSENYGLWNNTLMGCLPYLKGFWQLLCNWDDVVPCLTALLTSDNLTDTKSWEVRRAATTFYIQTFFDHFGRPPIVPHSLPMQS